jgi:hypothetical protein
MPFIFVILMNLFLLVFIMKFSTRDICQVNPLELLLKPQDFTERSFGNAALANAITVPQFGDCVKFRVKCRSSQVLHSRHIPVLFITIYYIFAFITIHVIKPFVESV